MSYSADAVIKQRSSAGYCEMEDIFNNEEEPAISKVSEQAKIEPEFVILSGAVENLLDELTDIKIKTVNSPYFKPGDDALSQEMNIQAFSTEKEPDIIINDLIDDVNVVHQLLLQCKISKCLKVPEEMGNSTALPSEQQLCKALTDLLCFIGKYDHLFLS